MTYFTKQIVKKMMMMMMMMMMLAYRNMEISILEINGESIITTLNKLSYMSHSRHHKRRDMQVTIKLLKVKYGPETTSTHRNDKHTGIETSTTRRWFYHSLSKELIYFLLNNGMMNCSCLNIEPIIITEQGMMRPKLKMVTLEPY